MLKHTVNMMTPITHSEQIVNGFDFSLNEHSLSHLPSAKRQQLKKAVAILLAMGHTSKASRPLMVILFGSYARGDWLEKRASEDQPYQYQSGFDLLVVTKTPWSAKKIANRSALQTRFKQEVETPVNLLAQEIQLVNHRLSKGLYFYTDMLREGIVLYDSGEQRLAPPCDLPSTERKKQASADYQHRFGKAMAFKKGFMWYFREQNYCEAAFLLHQITEQLYGAALLVFSRYKPSSHDLRKLGQHIASIEPQFVTVFPQGAQEDENKFELLRQAYVSARYQADFTISKQELSWLATRVMHLQALTERLCLARIASYE